MDIAKKIPKSAISEFQLRKLMKTNIGNKSPHEWSKDKGITPQQVSAFNRKVQSPGLKIPEVLGYRPQVIYIPLDEDRVSTPNPPRRPTDKPTSKVDHTKEPIEKKDFKAPTKKDKKKELKKRKKGKK
jgi:hypothetical protein